MGFLNLTYPNRRTFFITSFIILLFLLPLAISAQTVEFVSQSADGSVTMIVKDLPALSPVVRAEEAKLAKIPTPHYEYLWVFNDGEFINQSKDATVTHQFIGVEGSLRQGGATAFTTGVYSDDHLDLPPSARAVNGNSPGDIVWKNVPQVEVVNEGLLKLSSNQRGFVAGDKTVFIISVKNPNDFPISGYILFFSDPMIEKKAEGEARGEVNYELFEDETGTPVPAAFSKTLELAPTEPDFFLNEVPNQLFPESLKGRHAKVFRSSFGTLDSQEVRNFFVAFDVDEDLFDKGPKEEKGALRFTSVVTVDQTAGPDDFLTPQDSAQIESLSIQGLLDSLLLNDQPSGRLIADISTFEGEISRSHDPNYIRTEICECPEDSDGAFKLFCTVHFSNEGNVATNNISVSIAFPPEYDISSIPNELLSIYPQPETAILADRDPSTNTVSWNLAGFQLFPEAQFSPGHPLTYAEFQFTVLANPAEGKVDSIPYLQACIVFDGQEAVCTAPARPVAVQSSEAADILQCEACVSNAPPDNGGGEFPIPWWLLILLILILIILLIVAALRRRLFGS